MLSHSDAKTKLKLKINWELIQKKILELERILSVRALEIQKDSVQKLAYTTGVFPMSKFLSFFDIKFVTEFAVGPYNVDIAIIGVTSENLKRAREKLKNVTWETFSKVNIKPYMIDVNFKDLKKEDLILIELNGYRHYIGETDQTQARYRYKQKYLQDLDLRVLEVSYKEAYVVHTKDTTQGTLTAFLDKLEAFVNAPHNNKLTQN
jgi:hypothetical protein